MFYDKITDQHFKDLEKALYQNQPEKFFKTKEEQNQPESLDSLMPTDSKGSKTANVMDENAILSKPRIIEETKQFGRVASWVYWAYIKAGSNSILITSCVILFFASQMLLFGTDLWLSKWTDEAKNETLIKTRPIMNGHLNYTNQATENANNDTNISHSIIYSILIFSSLITVFARAFTFFYICNQSSINLHNSIFYRVLRSPINLFESQPIGNFLLNIDEYLILNAYFFQVEY